MKTLYSRTAAPSLAGALAMERQSVTAPGLGSEHGTGLPFGGSVAPTSVRTRSAVANRTAQAQAFTADVPGSPPRGGPV